MSKNLPAYEVFRTELSRRESEIASLLPGSITREAFLNAAIIAVKQNPALLTCERRSLHKAVTEAARDGLLPDGKEGVIIVHAGKSVRWQPMTFGLRKRAYELDGIIIDAQVVCENDVFEWEQGDQPRLVHKPARLGTERGEMIGAYAVFRKGPEILHREVMDAEQIAAVKAISKQPTGLMWGSFTGEAWRKSVVRRGIKTVPCSDALRQIASRDDEMYDVGRLGEDEMAPKPKDITPPRPGEKKPLPPRVGGKEEAEDASTILDAYKKALDTAKTAKAVAAQTHAHQEALSQLDEEAAQLANEMKEAALARIAGKSHDDSPTLDLTTR
jgi:recombination protein RecT